MSCGGYSGKFLRRQSEAAPGGVLLKFPKFHRKTAVLESPNKVGGLKPSFL